MVQPIRPEDSMPVGASAEQRPARTNLFLAAMLRAGATGQLVRIRNLSATGARIEATLPPLVGVAVTLQRGSDMIGGKVMWVEGKACGLAFDQRISVEAWIDTVRVGPAGQQSVERRVTAIRGDYQPVPGVGPEPEQRADQACDLALLARLIDHLGDRLAEDARLVAAHGQALQALDLAGQLLRGMADDRQPQAALDGVRASAGRLLGQP